MKNTMIIEPRVAQEVICLFPVPDGIGGRVCLRRHLHAAISLAVDWGMDPRAAEDLLGHYEERLGVVDTGDSAEGSP